MLARLVQLAAQTLDRAAQVARFGLRSLSGLFARGLHVRQAAAHALQNIALRRGAARVAQAVGKGRQLRLLSPEQQPQIQVSHGADGQTRQHYPEYNTGRPHDGQPPHQQQTHALQHNTHM